MDNIVDLTVDNSDRMYRIEVHGQPHGEPQCQPRARSSWRSKEKYYNPVSKELKAFKDVVRSAIPETVYGYLFPNGVCESMTVICYMKRPNSDFRNNQRGLGRLKGLLSLAKPQVPDIDNVAKFALDGLNKLVYKDDRQVVRLTIYKLADNEGECLGRTTLLLSAFNPQTDLPAV